MKIATAIGNEYLNKKLNKIKNYEIIGKDIQYQDGIFEILEINKDINLLILSDELPGKYSFYELIDKIKIVKKDIEIIVFLKEKNTDKENFLNSKNIYKIYYLNEENFDVFFYNLNIELKKDLSKEIEELKNIILLNKNYKKTLNLNNMSNLKFHGDIRKNKHFAIKNEEENNSSECSRHNRLNNCKTIAITGVSGVGKSIVSLILVDTIKNKKKRVLLIDFDTLNYTISSFYNIKNNNLLNLNNIKKVDENIFVLTGKGFWKDTNASNKVINKEKEEYFKKYINNLKREYDYIIIDTILDLKSSYIKTILYSGDKIIFLIEPNILEIKKARKILEVYINDFNFNLDKIKILFNKANKYKIAESILEELFSEFEIVGEIKYEDVYNLIINKNKIVNYDKNAYEKLYEKIG